MTNAVQIAGYIKSTAGLSTMDPFKLQKIVYFTQAWHLAWTGRPLFDEPFEAWPNGPVVRSVYRENRYSELPSSVDLDEETRSIIEAVVEHYCQFDTDTLIALTHADAPWIEARKGIAPGQPSRRPLDEKTMLDFYTAKALTGLDMPRRRAFVASGESNRVSAIGLRVIERWREGLDLLATK
jgi:uncharacterized phage-associated protein